MMLHVPATANSNSVANQSSSSGMCGPATLRAEVLRSLDDSCAEILLPETVDRNAGHQRVSRIGQPRGQPQAD